MEIDKFGIPIEFSNQLERKSIENKVSDLTERYRNGDISFSKLRYLTENVVSEGRLKDMLIDSELVPWLIFLSPDDAKNFKLKEQKNAKRSSKKHRS